ncbi:MAG TPA: [acyl-carrier-protein] S-malonyltransferase [Leucothrix mucor]|nr:[acyl-carrier-protein] S-malonyltransferase [Leucothrix mucor]
MAFAAVFPGQGSQSTGMLADLSSAFPVVKETFQQASDLLNKDLWQLTLSNDGSLNQTENTQPVMLAAGVAVWRVWQSEGGSLPVGMAGHSLGEYSALVASGVLSFDDAVTLVASRASFMQQAVADGEGAMAAIIGLNDKQVIDVCAQAAEDGVAEAVNFNSPGQVVIAGDTKAIDRAIEQLKTAGAKRAIKLAVSVPSHCSLMKGAAAQLAEKLLDMTLADSSTPVLHNVNAQNLKHADDIKLALSEQLFKPVRWVDTINSLKNDLSADTIIEFGPGKILFGLNRRIDRKLGNICIHDSASLEKALVSVGT